MKEVILDAIVETLIEKNKRYGNAALNPKHYFYKKNATDSIAIRLDDKISRIMNSGEPRKNDMFDILGYLFLYAISQNYSDVQRFEPDFTKQVKFIRDIVLKQKDLPVHDSPNGYFDGFTTTLYFIKGYGEVTDTIVFIMMAFIVAWFESQGIVDFTDLLD